MRKIDGLIRRQIYRAILKDLTRVEGDGMEHSILLYWDESGNLRITNEVLKSTYHILFYEEETVLARSTGFLHFPKLLSVIDTPEVTFNKIIEAVEADIL